MTSQHKRARAFRPVGAALLFALGFGTTAMVGCQPEEQEECVSLEQYFKEQIWAPILSQKCITCHNPQGAAKDSQFVLQSSDWTGYLEANLATVERMAKLQYEGDPWLLVKPTATVEHGGGVQLERGSPEWDAFVELIDRIENPVECEDKPIGEEYFADVELLDEVETLRKASLNLTGRVPTAEEEAAVAAGGEEALSLALDGLLREDAFYDRLVEIYNDHFLVDKYLSNSDAIDLLDGTDYPDSYWFDAIEDDSERAAAENYANDAVAREVTELVAYVVRNDRPFTEILTADYTVVNPWSAQTYGVNVQFDDPGDPDEFREARIPGIPHAGVLTSHIFLNRFPTTPTNRNRHRSRMVFRFFLATDILKLAERPIDPSAITSFNPTREDSNCTACHAAMDPVAGALQNWDSSGRYRPPEEGWYAEMFHPGFGDAELPSGDQYNATQWLAQQIVQDQRFAASQVHIVFQGLTGHAPLSEPSDPNAFDYLGRLTAFEVQNAELQRIAAAFIESEYDLRVVIKEIIQGPYYRAKNFTPEWSEEQAASDEAVNRMDEVSFLGTARWLTPEMLHRKIKAVTGYPWRREVDSDIYLLDYDQYRIFYGGIDSDTIIERMTAPNGIMTNISDRMSNEVACWSTARDFTKAAAVRKLFPYVEPGFEPEDENGFEIPAVTEAIRANIQYLHWHLLGERLDIGHPEIDRTYALFLEVWRDGKRGIGFGEYEAALPSSCQATTDFWSDQALSDAERITQDPNYTIRAWMAVMSYMLSDYRFLHE
ncbi:DUF1588 domain-containing protein [Pseudenhygromyxa sp. WMMC2535]|uniref:DUF1588 domain-containing protein n=1 Tax=Pseudenhygromyxa sp. WMMC2535 TaxID=2712867 RepID=UPI0015561872|nr:DUF1588 domain-containing protein [Pseudenhygromyxa sp. WMMC2535]NVB42371.1 DUF1588 domain-containing protein [Pseudenhygromyxa sp. WMMC2535]